MKKFNKYGYFKTKGKEYNSCDTTKQFVVKDEYRTNPLSHKPGGYRVKICKNGKVYVYDKVKNPKAYARKINGKLLNWELD